MSEPITVIHALSEIEWSELYAKGRYRPSYSTVLRAYTKESEAIQACDTRNVISIIEIVLSGSLEKYVDDDLYDLDAVMSKYSLKTHGEIVDLAHHALLKCALDLGIMFYSVSAIPLHGVVPVKEAEPIPVQLPIDDASRFDIELE